MQLHLPSLYRAACQGQAPGVEFAPPTILLENQKQKKVDV